MNTTTSQSVKSLLGDTRLVQGALPSLSALEQKAARRAPIKLVYGETYDSFGLTLDSLKYYFFVALLHAQLKDSQATVIVGDLHSVKNQIVKDKTGLLNEATTRIAAIKNINQIYGLDIQTALMSDLFEGPEFKARLNKITPVFNGSKQLQDIARRTVLTNRLAQEEKAGFQYAIEEVALISGFDIKVGPPRELHYDQLAIELGDGRFGGIYLKPTFPLGMRFDYFVNHPEIEEFGLTPYKAGSNKLQDQRIILGTTTPAQCKKLIDESFAATNPDLPSAVLDVYLISQMAGYFLGKNDLTINEVLVNDPQALKAATYVSLMANIYEPLELA
jgi:hypothetical protein